MIATQKNFSKRLGNCKRYCKRQFKKLIDKYENNGGIWENFGNNTISDCINYINISGIEDTVSYSDFCDMKADLRAVTDELTDILCSAGNGYYDYMRKATPELVQEAKDYLKERKLFEELNVEHYNILTNMY